MVPFHKEAHKITQLMKPRVSLSIHFSNIPTYFKYANTQATHTYIYTASYIVIDTY